VVLGFGVWYARFPVAATETRATEILGGSGVMMRVLLVHVLRGLVFLGGRPFALMAALSIIGCAAAQAPQVRLIEPFDEAAAIAM